MMHTLTTTGLMIAALAGRATPGIPVTLHVARLSSVAADTSAGTPARPFKTISAAMSRVRPGDTVLVHAGVYREAAIYTGPDWHDATKRCTLAAAPGEKVTIKGSDVLPTTWVRMPGLRPIYVQPRSLYTQMLFVDEGPLRQIGLQGNPKRAVGTNGFQFKKQWDGKGLADMRAGTFFYDDEAKRLCVWLSDGGNPANHTLEAAVRTDGISLQGTWTLRGIDVRHVADGFWPHEQAVAVNGNRSTV